MKFMETFSVEDIKVKVFDGDDRYEFKAFKNDKPIMTFIYRRDFLQEFEFYKKYGKYPLEEITKYVKDHLKILIKYQHLSS